MLAHPNPRRYPSQKVLVVAVMEYVYLVPHVEDRDHIFLKPSSRPEKTLGTIEAEVRSDEEAGPV